MKKKTPKEIFDLYGSINKSKLSSLVANKSKNIEKVHVDSVVNILFDYLFQKLVQDKKIQISNFLTFKFKKIGSRRARHYYTGELIYTKPYNRIYYILSKKFARKIMKHADIESYFKEKNQKS